MGILEVHKFSGRETKLRNQKERPQELRYWIFFYLHYFLWYFNRGKDECESVYFPGIFRGGF